MTTQLTRQLELNVTALSRGFRQALRHAQKVDPLGTPESSPAWKTVAERQAMLLTMLQAVGPFLQPRPELETPVPQPEAPPSSIAAPEPAVEIRAGETDDVTPESAFTSQDILDVLPPDVLELHEKMVAVFQWPTHTISQRSRRTAELTRLQGTLDQRLEELKSDLTARTQSG